MADWRKQSETLGGGVRQGCLADFLPPNMMRLITPADLRQLWTRGVPIEVVPFAAGHVLAALDRLYALEPVCKKALRRALTCISVAPTRPGHTSSTLRMGGAAKAGPVVTDNGNLVVDATFSQGPCTVAPESCCPCARTAC